MGSKCAALCACRPSVVILFECILILRSLLTFLSTWAHTGPCSTGCQAASPAAFLLGSFPDNFPHPVGLPGLTVTQVQHQHSALLNLMSLALAHWSSLSWSLCRALLASSRKSKLLLNRASSSDLLRRKFVFVQIIDKDILQDLVSARKCHFWLDITPLSTTP